MPRWLWLPALLRQNAFQAGLLIAPVLAVITTVDPLTSIGITHVWLNEPITSPPHWLARPSHWPS